MDEADVKSEQFGQERGAQALPKQFVVDFFPVECKVKSQWYAYDFKWRWNIRGAASFVGGRGQDSETGVHGSVGYMMVITKA